MPSESASLREQSMFKLARKGREHSVLSRAVPAKVNFYVNPPVFAAPTGKVGLVKAGAAKPYQPPKRKG
jgi:hypothetical protein